MKLGFQGVSLKSKDVPLCLSHAPLEVAKGLRKLFLLVGRDRRVELQEGLEKDWSLVVEAFFLLLSNEVLGVDLI